MEPLYQTDNYFVYVNEDKTGYIVHNVKTGVDEITEESLPAALTTALQMDRILTYDIWKKHAEMMTPIDNEEGDNVTPFPLNS